MTTKSQTIEPRIYNGIMANLARIERENKVSIIFAVESGSRKWGMSSRDSDYDVRFVYVNHGNWYLSIIEPKDDTIQVKTSMGVKMPSFEVPILDMVGWDLRKAMQLCNKSNPTLYEWCMSDIVYINDEADSIVKLQRQYMNLSTLYHSYRSIALNTWKEYFPIGASLAVTKKYFYVIRPLLAMLYISQNNAPPPVHLPTLVDTVDATPLDVKAAIISLLAEKRDGAELRTAPRIRMIDRWISAILQIHDRTVMPDTHKLVDNSPEHLDNYLRRQVYLASKKIAKRGQGKPGASTHQSSMVHV